MEGEVAIRLDRHPLHCLGDLLHRLSEIERVQLERQPTGGDPRHIEQHLDQPRQPIGAARGARQLPSQSLIAGLLDRCPHPVELEMQRGERRLELVRSDGEELVADAQRLLRADSVHVQPPPLVFSLLALGQIARHLGEPDQLARVASQRGDDHVCPESGSVLADAPPFVLDPPLFRRLGQQPGRTPLLPVLPRVKELNRLADDLFPAIPLDQRRPGVPGRHPSIAVEHEDRVVADALDQHAKTIVALLQRGNLFYVFVAGGSPSGDQDVASGND